MPLQPTKRTLMRATAGALLLLAAPLSMAHAWPARPIRLVVPFPPGGLIDNMARLVGSRLSQELGQPVVIDNKPGAGGNVGAAEVARAPADGYTLLMASPALTISPAIYKNLPYQPSQLAPVALLGRVPNVLLVNPASGIGKVQDLVGRAKAKPGQLNYASNGNGTSLHLSAELFKRARQTSGCWACWWPCSTARPPCWPSICPRAWMRTRDSSLRALPCRQGRYPGKNQNHTTRSAC